MILTKSALNEDHLRAHPLLSQILDAGSAVRAFRGYIAPSKSSDKVLLYPTLGDLSFHLEISRDDIVATAEAPETLLPHGGVVLWVQPDAEIKCNGDQINVISARRPMQTPGPIRVSPEGSPASTASGRFVNVTTGRLNIRVRPRVMSSCASCTCSSCETHPSCTSTCKSEIARSSIEIGP